jgi:hypothetical protein
MIQQSHSWEYNQRNATQDTPKASAHPCLLQRYSQWPSYGSNHDAPVLMMHQEYVVFTHSGILLSHQFVFTFYILSPLENARSAIKLTFIIY